MNTFSFHTVWYFVIAALLGLGAFYYFMHKQEYISPVSYIVKDGNLSSELQHLLKLSYIEYDGTFQNAVQVTQKYWLRPAHVERWEMDNTTYANRKEIWDSFETLHLVQRIDPVHSHYTYLIVLGDTYDAIKLKFEFIVQCWHKGIRFKKIIFLGSDRSLVYDLETDYMMHDFSIDADVCPKTESAMMEFVYNRMQMPDKLHALKPTIISVPCKDAQTRPTTQDTVQAWLESKPEKGTCLIVSAQPYIAYQHAVCATYLPYDWYIETVGPSTSEFIHTGVYFDTLARILYQENIRMNMQKA